MYPTYHQINSIHRHSQLGLILVTLETLTGKHKCQAPDQTLITEDMS